MYIYIHHKSYVQIVWLWTWTSLLYQLSKSFNKWAVCEAQWHLQGASLTSPGAIREPASSTARSSDSPIYHKGSCKRKQLQGSASRIDWFSKLRSFCFNNPSLGLKDWWHLPGNTNESGRLVRKTHGFLSTRTWQIYINHHVNPHPGKTCLPRNTKDH